MSKSKILACPFCGKPPTIKQAGRTNYWWVGCEIHLGPESSGCGVSHSDYIREEAIRKWNERAGGRQPEPSDEASDKHIALQGLVRRLADDWERLATEIQHDFGRNGGEGKLTKADTLWWCARRLREELRAQEEKTPNNH